MTPWLFCKIYIEIHKYNTYYGIAIELLINFLSVPCFFYIASIMLKIDIRHMNCTRNLEISSILQNWVIVKGFLLTIYIIPVLYFACSNVLWLLKIYFILLYTQKHLGQHYKLKFFFRYWFHCKNNSFIHPKTFSPILVQ